MSNAIYDYSKLRGRIKEIYGNQNSFAIDLGVSTVTLSSKLTNKVGFSQSEMTKAAELLRFQETEIPIYFFTRKVQKTKPS